MRIIDRIARLERRQSTNLRMTAAEINAAASRFDASLARGGAPATTTEDLSKAGWRACVEAPGPGWRQRIFAYMELEDFFL